MVVIDFEMGISTKFKLIKYMINMNLPAINNKMKNQNSSSKQENSGFCSEGFGLGIQVFKIQSVRSTDGNLKSKNRTTMKNIQNPVQTANYTNYKPPTIPKSKKLPILQRSSSDIHTKQRLSGFINSRNSEGVHTGYSDKIAQRKTPTAQTITMVTPVSYSMRKKVGLSTQKNNTGHQGNKPAYMMNAIIQHKQRPINKVGVVKPNQTAPQIMQKPEQIPYLNYHEQHDVLVKFYSEFQASQKQHLKQIRQLKKLKQTEKESEQIYDRIQYLQSSEGKIQTVIQNMERRQFQDRTRQANKLEDKKQKRTLNSIVPVTGFPNNQMHQFQSDSIQHYQLQGFGGSFKVCEYENVDFAPPVSTESNDRQG